LGSVEIEVKVPDLELLPDATDPDDYVKIGGTCQHHGPDGPAGCDSPDNNHWGTHDVIDALQDIAFWYDFVGGSCRRPIRGVAALTACRSAVGGGTS